MPLVVGSEKFGTFFLLASVFGICVSEMCYLSIHDVMGEPSMGNYIKYYQFNHIQIRLNSMFRYEY